MTQIAQLMSDITEKLKTVPALNGRVGMAAGGKPGDPTMRGAKIPFAWPIYSGDNARTTQTSLQSTPVTHEVIVKVALTYGTEKEMTEVMWPALQSVIEAVTATPIAAIKGQCLRWSYMGQSLEEIDERLVYVQRYSVQGNV